MLDLCSDIVATMTLKRKKINIEFWKRKIKFKGIGSILFLKNGSKKNCRKKYIIHLRNDNYEVCTAVARYFSNILDVMIIEHIYKCLEIKCGDRHEGLMK
jgi:hypothetical protein